MIGTRLHLPSAAHSKAQSDIPSGSASGNPALASPGASPGAVPAPRRPRRLAFRAPLPPAVDAPREEAQLSGAGLVSWYKSTGGAGRPLVLIHSINAAPSVYEMKPLFERYAGQRPVYAPDLPGFGFSDRSDRVYSPELFATAITAFLRDTVGEPADVVALSLSCEFAARVAVSEPSLIATLTLLSPTGFSTRTMKGGKTGKRVHDVISLPGLGSGAYSLLTVRPSIRFFLNQSFADAKAPDGMVDYAYATSHRPGAHHCPLYFLSGQLFTQDAPHTLYAQVTQPVLVLHDKDPNLNFDLLEHFLGDRPNWRVVRISPTHGLPHWEKPEETAAEMERFWADHA